MTSGIVSSLSERSDATRIVLNILCKRSEGLKVCHFNSQSLLPKIDEFRDIFSILSFDFIFVSETWFKPHFPDNLINLLNYKLYRNDRVTHGGGVAIYIHNSITARVVGFSSATSEVEFIFIETIIDNAKCLFGCVYKPPKIANIAGTELETFLSHNCHKYNHVCIAGDFNFNLLFKDSTSNSFIDFVKSFGMHFVNSFFPTHFTSSSSSLLDLFLLSDTELIDHYDQVSVPAFSKHDLIYLSLNLTRLRSTESDSIEFTYRDFNQVNLDALLQAADGCDWQSLYNTFSVDEQVDIFDNFIVSLFDRFVPTRICRSKYSCPWYMDNLRLLQEKRDSAYRIWKRFRTHELLQKYRKLRNRVVIEIRKSKARFFRKKLNIRLPPKTLWKNLQCLGIGRSSQPTVIEMDVNELNSRFVGITNSSVSKFSGNSSFSIPECTDGFAFDLTDCEEVFKAIFSIRSNATGFDGIHPKFIKVLTPVIVPHITLIFNNIIQRSYFPCKWKRAKIVPVPKKSKTAAPEYRPIAILPYLAKVFEKIISKQIIDHVDKNNMITDFQSGFRKNKSCVSALLKISDDIRIAFDNDMITVLVLLDFSKAFDSVDHQLLLRKLLNNFGFTSSATKLIGSYLLHRSQSVFANNSSSSFLPNFVGVPQGSILGPLLFSLFINDLPSAIKNCSYHIYADDVQIYLSRPIGLIEDAIARINEDLTCIHEWSSVNKLHLNASKSFGIPFSRVDTAISEFPNIKLDNVALSTMQTVTNLGIKFDNRLTWTEHINSLVGKIFGTLQKLSISAHYTPVETRLRLAKCLIVPLISYGCELFAGANISVMRKLETAYNAVTRYVFGLRKFDHVSEYKTRILGCELSKYLNLRSLLYLRKVILSRKPDYLAQKVKFDDTTRSLSITPCGHRYLVSEKQFFIRSIRLWNDLPLDIRRQYSSSKFEKILFHFYTAY